LETSKFIGGLARAIVDVAVFGAMSVQPRADQAPTNGGKILLRHRFRMLK